MVKGRMFVTGDTHGSTDHWKLYEFCEQHPDLTKDDYMIIAGDFGGVWSKSRLKSFLALYSGFPFITLFVDGNHENFDMLNEYPIEEWNGGKVHKITDDIIHLMRGQVYEILGRKIFTFGGATSIDKMYRVEHISWWKEEIPTFEELDEAFRNLERHNNKVDYIITHACDERALYYPPLKTPYVQMTCFIENQMLSNFEERVDYKHWYFGHYHLDGDLTDRKTALYNNIVELD